MRLDLVDGAGAERRQDVDLERPPDLRGVLAWSSRATGAVCHSFATSRKVGIVDAPACCSFSARLAADGSSSLRASAHRSRASASPTFGYGPEAERLLFAVDAVLAAPELAAGRRDDQVQAIAIKQLALLVGRLGVLDFLDRQHLGVFSGWGYFIPPNIPPERAQRPDITRYPEICFC